MTVPLPLSRLRPGGQAGNDPQGDAVRVMIVDDSLTVRTVFKRMVESDGAMAIAGTASSAERAIAQLEDTPADVILLDLEMPGMGGLDALPKILATAKNAQVLVVSSLTQDGAEHTMAALSTGAADTMLKPRPGGFNDEYRDQLLSKIRALGGIDKTSTGAADAPEDGKPAAARFAATGKRPLILAIGASTGGIHALNQVLHDLPPTFDLPILITQHLPASFIPVFARQIETVSGRKTHVADEGSEIRPGEITIAAGHGHMVVYRRGEQFLTRCSSEPARSGCMPSVDPMLSSLAKECHGHVLAVILSGMGRDGSEAAAELVEAGGSVFAQDAETSAVWGMPGAVTKAGLASLVASPEGLRDAILSHAGLKKTGAATWK